METADIESDKKGTEKEKTAEIEQGNLFILIVGNGFECLFVILKLHIPPPPSLHMLITHPLSVSLDGKRGDSSSKGGRRGSRTRAQTGENILLPFGPSLPSLPPPSFPASLLLLHPTQRKYDMRNLTSKFQLACQHSMELRTWAQLRSMATGDSDYLTDSPSLLPWARISLLDMGPPFIHELLSWPVYSPKLRTIVFRLENEDEDGVIDTNLYNGFIRDDPLLVGVKIPLLLSIEKYTKSAFFVEVSY